MHRQSSPVLKKRQMEEVKLKQKKKRREYNDSD
jgi:hypothetical protein